MDELLRDLRALAEHHEAHSDEVGDVEFHRALTCKTAASMLEYALKRPTQKEANE